MRIKTYRNGRLVHEEIEGELDIRISNESLHFIAIAIAVGSIIMFAIRIAATFSHINLC